MLRREDTAALVAKAVDGDKRAAMQLVGVVYADKVCAAIYKHYPRYAYPRYREARDELLHQFLLHVITPDSNGNWRLRKLNADGNPEGYLYRMALNFLIDRHDTLRRRGELDTDFKEPMVKDPGSVELDEFPEPAGNSGTSDFTEPAGNSEPAENPADMPEAPVVRGHIMVYDEGDRRRMAIVEMLNKAAGYSARERYIISTKLLSTIVKPVGEVMYLADNIADALRGVPYDGPKDIYHSYNRFRKDVAKHVYGIGHSPKDDKKKGKDKKQ